MSEVIRQATEQDLDAIVRLWREMAELHQEIEPLVWTLGPEPDGPARQHFADCLANPDYRLFVAQRGEEGRLEIITAYDDQDETRRFKRDHPEVIAERSGPDLAGRGRYRSR